MASEDKCAAPSSTVRGPGMPTEGTVGPGIVAVTLVVTSAVSGHLLTKITAVRPTLNVAVLLPGLTGTLMMITVVAIGPDLSASVMKALTALPTFDSTVLPSTATRTGGGTKVTKGAGTAISSLGSVSVTLESPTLTITGVESLATALLTTTTVATASHLCVRKLMSNLEHKPDTDVEN